MSQKIVIRETKFSWRPVTSSVQGLLIFNIFVNKLDDEVEGSLRNFAVTKHLKDWSVQQIQYTAIQKTFDSLG